MVITKAAGGRTQGLDLHRAPSLKSVRILRPCVVKSTPQGDTAVVSKGANKQAKAPFINVIPDNGQWPNVSIW